MKRTVGAVGIIVATLLAQAPIQAAPVITNAEFAIPMDDGVRIYGWARYAEPLRPRPVILMVTTYGHPLGAGPAIANLAGYGEEDFTFVTVHVRGTGASEGIFDFYGPRTKDDAWGIIDHVSKQPWSDRSVMSHGGSGNGVANFDNMISGHPALKAAAVWSTVFDFYRDLWWPGGAGPSKVPFVVFPALPGNVLDRDNLDARGRLGLRTDIVPQQVLAIETWFAEAELRSTDGPFWRERSTWEELPASTVPVIIETSFREIVPWNQSIAAFLRAPNAWLSLGKGHETVGSRVAQEYVGPRTVRFARHFMLGEDNGFESEPRILLETDLGSVAGHPSGSGPDPR